MGIKRLNREHLGEILGSIRSEFSGLKTELVYETPFQFLVAVMLSAQATDKQVNKITKSLFTRVREAKDVLALSEGELLASIRSINYFNAKARHIRASAEMLVALHDGNIPNSIDELLGLPGVGIKTAKVVLSVLYDAPFVGVDTHVHRVMNRLGLVNTKSPLETDAIIEARFSLEEKYDSHHALVLFGRYRCTAISPKCEQCNLRNVCKFYQKRLKKEVLK